eukprot:TRINITY_DN407_c0_g1_i2.p1 TRINITY_DN407_c0_g1~~TRINITY_DN407_c0_g1_i2.p1  ORF type:complete len:234 (+),score=38.88 TRINITY_DN407_c0_g1_i2:23-703(+)
MARSLFSFLPLLVVLVSFGVVAVAVVAGLEPPTIPYAKQFSATLSWDWVNATATFEMYYDYTLQSLRLDAIDEHDGQLGALNFPSTVIEKVDSSSVLNMWIIDPLQNTFCEFATKSNVSTLDPTFPFKGSKYVGVEFAPTVNRLAFHYSNVTLSTFFLGVDMWFDAFTGEYLYVKLPENSDPPGLIFSNFRPAIDPRVFDLPPAIQSLCKPIAAPTNDKHTRVTLL